MASYLLHVLLLSFLLGCASESKFLKLKLLNEKKNSKIDKWIPSPWDSTVSYYLSSHRKTRKDASSFCRDYFSELASVTSQQENEFLFNLSSTYTCRWLGGNIKWKGMGAKASIVSTTWMDNTKFNFGRLRSGTKPYPGGRKKVSYPWYPGEPNNKPLYGKHNEECLTMGLPSKVTSGWNDYSCNSSCNFVCKRVSQPTPAPPGPNDFQLGMSVAIPLKGDAFDLCSSDAQGGTSFFTGGLARITFSETASSNVLAGVVDQPTLEVFDLNGAYARSAYRNWNMNFNLEGVTFNYTMPDNTVSNYKIMSSIVYKIALMQNGMNQSSSILFHQTISLLRLNGEGDSTFLIKPVNITYVLALPNGNVFQCLANNYSSSSPLDFSLPPPRPLSGLPCDQTCCESLQISSGVTGALADIGAKTNIGANMFGFFYRKPPVGWGGAH